jgi:hypothetical protein
MKKGWAIGTIFLLLVVSQPRAGLFDWVPIPKFDFDDIVHAVRKALKVVDDVVINPVVNLGKDAFENVLGAFVSNAVITEAVKQQILQDINQNVKDTYGIVLCPTGNADVDASLTVFTDPVTGHLLFQDNLNKSRYAYSGLETADLPTVGLYTGDEDGYALVEPRGIVTDYSGNFWVADARTGRIHRLQYDNTGKRFILSGVITGFDHPYSVAFSPGPTDLRDDDVLYVVDARNQSLCRIEPWFGKGDKVDNTLGYSCTHIIGGAVLDRPLAVAVENNSQPNAKGSPSVLYVAFAGNQIAKVQDIGGTFTLLGVTAVGSSSTSKITGLSCDVSGLLYAVDNGTSQVLYLNTTGAQLSKIFAFGSQGTGSTLNTVKFNNPKSIALYGNTVTVSETWSGSSGIQRFHAVPTLDRANTSVALDPGNSSVMKWNLALSQEASVRLSLSYYSNPANLANGIEVFNTDLSLSPGVTAESFPFVGNTGGFDQIPLFQNGLYRYTISVFTPSDPTTPTDIYSNDVVLSIPTGRPKIEVQMKENAFGEPNISKPQLRITNLSSSPIQGFTVRLWMSRDEMPSQSVIIDPYYTVPSPLSISMGYHPRNSHIVYADFTYPSSYVLNPGQSTGDADFQVGIHFQNYYPGQWNRTNDFSWNGVTASYAPNLNVTIIGSNGRILHGNWPEVLDAPAPPAPPANRKPVLGFERVSDWSAPQAQLSSNTTTLTEGLASLSIRGSGWFPVKSAAMTTGSITDETAHLALDVFVPGSQPNPWWLGSIDLIANCPSANLYNAYIGHAELTPLPQGQFSTVNFTVPQNVLAVLQGNFSDFSMEFDINVNAGAPPVLFDYLRFVP